MTMVPSLLLLGAMCAAGEGEAQRLAVGAGPRHRRAGEEARERRVADLGVALAVVLVLDPGLRRLVEQGQREVRHMPPAWRSAGPRPCPRMPPAWRSDRASKAAWSGAGCRGG